MCGYATWYTIVPVLEDGRLARAVVTAKRVSFEHREGHIDPVLMFDLEEFSRHLSQSGLYALDLARLGIRPVSDSYVMRVPDDLICPLCTFTLRRGEVAGRPFWEFRVRASMMSADLAAELNEEVFPGFFGAVVPITMLHPKEPPVPDLDSFDLGA